MKNSIEELKKYEQNMYTNIISNYNIKNNITQTLRNKLEEKKQIIKKIELQIKFLDSESLDLTSEILRLINEIEMKSIYEK